MRCRMLSQKMQIECGKKKEKEKGKENERFDPKIRFAKKNECISCSRTVLGTTLCTDGLLASVSGSRACGAKPAITHPMMLSRRSSVERILFCTCLKLFEQEISLAMYLVGAETIRIFPHFESVCSGDFPNCTR